LGVLAYVIVSKFADHLPLYRQVQICACDGMDTERSTLSQWVGGVSRLLRPLVDALRRYVLAGPMSHADDTPVAVIALGKGRAATTRRTYVRNESPAASTQPAELWMAPTPDREDKTSSAQP
jgi:transposase